MLHNLFFYFEYTLFNPSKIKSVPNYFSALLMYLCLCYVKGNSQANGCIALKCCQVWHLVELLLESGVLLLPGKQAVLLRGPCLQQGHEMELCEPWGSAHIVPGKQGGQAETLEELSGRSVQRCCSSVTSGAC